jgi:hypothetical protein
MIVDKHDLSKVVSAETLPELMKKMPPGSDLQPFYRKPFAPGTPQKKGKGKAASPQKQSNDKIAIWHQLGLHSAGHD